MWVFAHTLSPSLPVPSSGGISLLVPLSFFGRDESPPDTIKLSRLEQKLKRLNLAIS
jgi:hypothetical protein